MAATWPHGDEIRPEDIPPGLLEWAVVWSTRRLQQVLAHRKLEEQRLRADCPGICWESAPGDVARDSECPIHGVDADPAWWRTPHHQRTDPDHDNPPPEPTSRTERYIGGLRP